MSVFTYPLPLPPMTYFDFQKAKVIKYQHKTPDLRLKTWPFQEKHRFKTPIR